MPSPIRHNSQAETRQYRVTITREYTEQSTISVTAIDAIHAQEIADDMIANPDHYDIDSYRTWTASRPTNERVTDVEERIPEVRKK